MRLINANDEDFMQEICTTADVYLALRKYLADAPTIDAVPRSDYERLKRERDAAVHQLKELARCTACKYADVFVEVEPCLSCRSGMGSCFCEHKWEWRGVQDG